jgi:ABC-type lipoprotein release transport system permease subunit
VAVLTAQSPSAWCGVLALLVASAMLSSAAPVLRALRVDPSVVLRQE